MNKVILMGRLTADPDVRQSTNTQTPTTVSRYRLAVRRPYAKTDGQEADFINVVTFGKAAEFASKYLSKGRMITIVGHIREDIWEDANKVKHHNLQVIAQEQYFADSKSNNQTAHDEHADEEIAVSQLSEEELPF